jgi:hypothetical protein
LKDPNIDFWVGRRHLWKAWMQLGDEEPTSARVLAGRIGRTVRTAQRTLTKLAELGLARSDGDDGWYGLVPPVEITLVERDKRKERHAEKRLVFVNWTAYVEVIADDDPAEHRASERSVLSMMTTPIVIVAVAHTYEYVAVVPDEAIPPARDWLVAPPNADGVTVPPTFPDVGMTHAEAVEMFIEMFDATIVEEFATAGGSVP